MRLFVGTLDGYKLDSKGRLSVPTKWRESWQGILYGCSNR